MIVIKNKQAIDKMRTAGKLLAEIMEKVKIIIEPGIDSFEIDFFIEKNMHEVGLKPVCKGYAGYKHATCISINDVVIHGVPSKNIILKTGDLIKIDVVGAYKNYCADLTRSYFVGNVSESVKKIVEISQKALDSGILEVQIGKKVSDISKTIEKIVKDEGFEIVRNFAGHGIGKNIHELPEIPNFYQKGNSDTVLRPGMTFAIEPMITEKGYEIFIESDGWTVKTLDGGLAGHVEDTILVTESGPEILTRL
ncbi:TPA: type I methionyl aminopeptidase [Candidatus Dependentiae bacterium]|nr:MAG: Methionine aminopeptidase [candidate division TM6 bacterium GW2011_GWE2_31_21]KKP53107.1 MAG: Methionine aminopeptidase [candidate division TM6 bacterium GW2011_GWF2_33_332]HBS47926.1 type I methionyl aminopeptidase [Candidatus Dependentiae bacterium]HBZ73470.1 type I methionyl aminopeptidase [Candidatus Dependentiae bacterium]